MSEPSYKIKPIVGPIMHFAPKKKPSTLSLKTKGQSIVGLIYRVFFPLNKASFIKTVFGCKWRKRKEMIRKGERKCFPCIYLKVGRKRKKKKKKKMFTFYLFGLQKKKNVYFLLLYPHRASPTNSLNPKSGV